MALMFAGGVAFCRAVRVRMRVCVRVRDRVTYLYYPKDIITVTPGMRNCTQCVGVTQSVGVTQGGGGGGGTIFWGCSWRLGGEEVGLEEKGSLALGVRRVRLRLASPVCDRLRRVELDVVRDEGGSGVGLRGSSWPGGLERGSDGELGDDSVPALRDELLGLRAAHLAWDPAHGPELGEGEAGPLGEDEDLLEDGERGEVLEVPAEGVLDVGGERGCGLGGRGALDLSGRTVTPVGGV